MTAAVGLFLFGLAAGFVLMRLRRSAPSRLRPGKHIEALARVVMSAALTLAIALTAWGIVGIL